MLLLQRLTRPLREIAQRLNSAILRFVIPQTIKPQGALTDEDYQELLELAHQQGTLARSEKEIILQIIQLDKRTAKDVMRPRAQMDSIPDDLSIEEMIAAARRYKHRRLPIYDETPDTVAGISIPARCCWIRRLTWPTPIEFPRLCPKP
jgi:CBS domain containing-hemolysin-like protein